MVGSTPGTSPLRDAYRKVCDRIAAAAERSGRKAKDVLMVAVTKNATPDQIRGLVEMGHIDLGESRVQQLGQRVAQLNEFLARHKTLGGAVVAKPNTPAMPEEVRWHMIGHLQRNKVKQVVPLVKLVHGVDSLRLAEELHNYAARTEQVVDVLVQVNASGEASKHGISPPAVPHIVDQIETMLHLRCRGLMTMAPHTDNPEDARGPFARTAELFNEIRGEKVGRDGFNILSMGMTNDFEIAIEEGANIVRIGRALFGETESE
ncbi:YggS family pyridoxal phosphate-dependent enzyme [Phycisphaerales bacterium AB-hyl4]|uniref:Pyridoxal phosphate homeostasis protein n=1 Tax=Natronomicrosphaera hydrolytica TaxID=3242702 RepID=A0ABV4U2A3_9BACT